MGQAYVQFTESQGNAPSAWTIYAYMNEITVSDSSFTLPAFTSKIGYWIGANKNEAKAFYNIAAYAGNSFLGSAYTDLINGPLTDRYYQWGPGAWVEAVTSNNITGATCYTSWLFNSSNKDRNWENITFKYANITALSKDTNSTIWGKYENQDGNWYDMIGGMTVTLNAPPIFTIPTAVTRTPTTHPYYKGYTGVSVKVTNIRAQYGGYIKSVKLRIGTQEVGRENYTESDQPASSGVTLTIDSLNVSGTNLVPTVIVTDSRGQTTTKTLNQITVKEYHKPTVTITNVEHIDRDSLKPDDEGKAVLVTAKFTCNKDNVSNLTSPTVALKNADGSNVSGFTPTYTWFSTRNSSTLVPSGSVTWSNVTSGSTLYLKVGNDFNPNNAYQIQITPRDIDVKDSIISGTRIDGTIPAAFFTVDFLAGGHGIAFGTPAVYEGFTCNMSSYFPPLAGTIMMYAGVTPPDGWLICDGSAISRTAYSKLFLVIGTRYGVGNGSTTFNLPNLQGRVVIGATSPSYTIGSTGGSETVTLEYSDSGILNSSSEASGYGLTATAAFQNRVMIARGEGATAHNNIQPYLALNYIIHTGKN